MHISFKVLKSFISNRGGCGHLSSEVPEYLDFTYYKYHMAIQSRSVVEIAQDIVSQETKSSQLSYV